MQWIPHMKDFVTETLFRIVYSIVFMIHSVILVLVFFRTNCNLWPIVYKRFKPYENDDTLRGQNLPLKCYKNLLKFQYILSMGLDLYIHLI